MKGMMRVLTEKNGAVLSISYSPSIVTKYTKTAIAQEGQGFDSPMV